MKSTLPGVLAALAALLVANSAAAQTKIAAVDVRGAIMRTEDGLAAAASIRSFTQRRQADLSRREEELKREQNDIRKQAGFLPRLALARRSDHWQRRMVEAQSKMVEYNKQLQRREANLINPIMQKMIQIVRHAANKRGVDLIIDRASAPYIRPDLDLTDLVVQLYNSGEGISAAKKKSKKKGKKKGKKKDGPK